MKKGVAEIITIALLVGLLVSISIVAFYSFSKLQVASQENVGERYVQHATKKASAEVIVRAAEFNILNSTLELTLGNAGEKTMPIRDNSAGDNFVKISKAGTSCVVALSSTTCPDCPASFGQGGVAHFNVNFNGTRCTSLTSGIQYPGAIIFNNGVLADFSVLPESTYMCNVELNLVENHTCISPSTVCMNYSITNYGNAKDQIGITFSLNVTNRTEMYDISNTTYKFSGNPVEYGFSLAKDATTAFVFRFNCSSAINASISITETNCGYEDANYTICS